MKIAAALYSGSGIEDYVLPGYQVGYPPCRNRESGTASCHEDGLTCIGTQRLPAHYRDIVQASLVYRNSCYDDIFCGWSGGLAKVTV